jgi:hypothetical protein
MDCGCSIDVPDTPVYRKGDKLDLDIRATNEPLRWRCGVCGELVPCVPCRVCAEESEGD